MTEPVKNNPNLVNVTRKDFEDCLESVEKKNKDCHLIPKVFSVEMEGLKGFGVNFALLQTIKENGEDKKIMVPVGLVVIDQNDKAFYQLSEEFKPKPTLIKPNLILN